MSIKYVQTNYTRYNDDDDDDTYTQISESYIRTQLFVHIQFILQLFQSSLESAAKPILLYCVAYYNWIHSTEKQTNKQNKNTGRIYKWWKCTCLKLLFKVTKKRRELLILRLVLFRFVYKRSPAAYWYIVRKEVERNRLNKYNDLVFSSQLQPQ